MKNLNNIRLQDLLPPNLSADSNIKATASAIDPHLNELTIQTKMALIYARLKDLSSLQLDHLAVQFHVAAWDSLWPRETKLSVLLATVETKRRRGTLKAVKAAVGAMFEPFFITEWGQQTPKGQPFTFNIEIPLDDIGKDMTFRDQEDLYALVYEAKSIRSHGSITLRRKFTQTIRVGAAMSAGNYAQIRGDISSIEVPIRVGSVCNPASYVRIS